MPILSQDAPTALSLTLADGRRLGYAQYGAPAGRPVLYLHGLPGSRLECRLIDSGARAAGLRVIAPDRPGYGLSTPRADESLLAWTADVAALCRSLAIETFQIIGVSGGAPCALACAHALPTQVQRVLLVAGLGPLHDAALRGEMRASVRLLIYLAHRHPRLFRLSIGRPVAALGAWAPALLIRAIALLNGGRDRQILSRPDIRAAFLPSLRACFAQGSAGSLKDLRLFRQPWGFEPADIQRPVQLWHGTCDRVVPLSHSQYLHARLADSTLEVVPGAGHFSLPLEHMALILSSLTE